VTRANHTLVSGWCLHHFDDAFNTTQRPNPTFPHIFECATMFSFTRCDTWWCMVVKLSLMFFLSLLPNKVHNCFIWLWFFNLSPHSFDFLFCSYYFYKSFICFQFSSSITISHMFFFISVFILYSFDFFSWPFC
jgi:hypothetical protein